MWPSLKLELHLRRLAHVLGHGEVLHGLSVRIEERAPPAAGNGPDLGVVVLDRLDVVAPCDGDAILRALELRLKRQEILIRLEVGDRKSTRLNSSHSSISYAVFCLKK